MFHHRPLQHCLFTHGLCFAIPFPSFLNSVGSTNPHHTYPTGRLVGPNVVPPGSEKLRATSTAGLCESLNLPSAARRLQEERWACRSSVVWGDGYPLGGGARKTWCLIQIYLVIGDVGKVGNLTWVGAFFHGLLTKSAWICSNNSDWWSIQVYFMGGSTQSIRTHHTSSRQLSSP